MLTTDGAPPREVVGPLVRGLAVLRRVAGAGGRRSAGDLVRDTGLARSTIDRVLSTLERLGHLRLEGRDAVLAPGLMELGNAYLAACGLPALLGPLADRLADELDESVSVAVPDGDRVRFVHQAARRRAMSVAFRVGDALPAECGAPGALFAAGWTPGDWKHWRRCRTADPDLLGFWALPPEAAPPDGRAAGGFQERAAAARRTGWSLDDQLIEPGLVAVALPVRDAAGRPVCAVSVVSHTSRHTAESLREAVLGALRETVARMEHALVRDARRAGAGVPPQAVAAERARTSKRELGPEFVESLARGLGVLTAFGEDRPQATLATLAQATGLPRATVRRSLITLAHLGYVTADDGLFRPAPRVLELGFAQVSAGLTVARIARPHLVSLVERIRDSASMAVLDGDDIRYVARVPTVRIMSVDITLGTRLPAYATSMGRVLLAGLPEEERARRLARARLEPLTRRTVTDPARLEAILAQVGRDGHALVDEELEEGLRSIAVPVRDRAGRVTAAVNVSMHASRRTARQAVESLLPALRDAAARIEADLHVAGRFVRLDTD
ncbi:transcriptional regulator, IclR family [Thermomonospora echinospora]|uniref:Glycerol operon regulatory protein n=1 Tax=Thermomonospora echinospora TaxID=1992 RepID=A0A1H6BMZ2_9ACTN|nr:IclR family transcriptional regulator C-terminal domain-containing protein [Thermomonospora echinospora]SEG62040.1 transcriptional regulator, IclR family [Thermomonospora echinospora]